jgi:ketosteroid isomerase-like protein
VTTPDALADRIRAAYQSADLAGLSDLLAPDVRWGDDDHPNRCRSRDDVLRTFSGWLGKGVSADVLNTDTGSFGVAFRLHVNWTDPTDRARGFQSFHVFMLRDGQITEIRRYNDSRSARKAITRG